MNEKEKSTTFKIIITILILLLALIIGLVIFAFAKFHSNNSIREPLDRDHSQLRQKFKRWRSNDRCVIWY